MAEAGLWITNDNGKTYFNLAQGGARSLTFLRRLSISVGAGGSLTVTTNIMEKSSGSTLVVVPVHPGEFFQDFGPSLAVWASITKSISMSGSNVIISLTGDTAGIPLISKDGNLLYDVYETSATGTGTYGLYLPDSSDFSAITNATKAGFCVYRTTITLGNNQSWTVPTNIPGRDNCSVFGNWSNSGASVEYVSTNKTVYVRNTTVTINIAIFSNGFNLTMPDYGLYIFNSSGQCTYNSNYIPMFYKNTVNFNSGGVVNTGIARPLVPLGVYGLQGNAINGGESWEIWSKGLMMNGSSVGATRGRLLANWYTDYYQPEFPNMTLPLIVLDASHYFN
nr:MAG TPA: hypothetical protein [Caudoviricetes sp.]